MNVSQPSTPRLTRRSFIQLAGVTAAAAALAGSGAASAVADETESDAASAGTTPTLDPATWSYDSDNDVYWQIGVVYCSAPAATEYESLGIYVPGAYFDATDNGDGTFTCTPSETGSVAGYTASTAPIVMPINTAGYSSQPAPTSYSYNGLSSYLEAGFVYVYAGCRGRENGTNPDGTSFAGGAPWGVTDLKAAVRFVRANGSNIPGSAERIFSFGMSGGGAQSALLGATGDSDLYDPYLESIGAVFEDADGNEVSDALFGSMCWCPITSLDIGDCAYEWMMGQFSSTGVRAEGTFTRELGLDMAAVFADYVNGMGFVDPSGSTLTLEASDEGVYLAGSYYDYLVSVVEDSLNSFLEVTEFPYTADSTVMADGGFAGGGDAGGPDGELGDLEELGGEMGEGGPDADGGSSGETYETVQDYIASLNSDEEWVAYDEETNTATVTSLGGFVRACKPPTKNVGAFDDLDRSQGENQLFGCAQSDYLHFDAYMAQLLEDNQDTYAQFSDWDSAYPQDYADDRQILDDLGNDSDYRQDAYNPLYYLCSAFEGCGTSTPASHWRIHSGIEQGDTSLTTELNLALALEASDAVDSVSFQTVWGLGHTTAELTGDSTTNFVSWVNDCCA